MLIISGLGTFQWDEAASSPVRYLSVIVLIPLLEEWIFRGWLLDALRKRTQPTTLYSATGRSLISQANALSTFAFVALHALTRDPMSALAVMIPSLYLGKTKEVGAHWLHCAALHGFWNLSWFSVMPLPEL